MLIADGASCLRPCLGEIKAGDFSHFELGERYATGLLVDVVGHGQGAFNVGELLMGQLQPLFSPRTSPQEIFDRAHTELKGTRGACMAVIQVDLSTGQGSFCGVGSNFLRKCGHQKALLWSQDGLLGHSFRTLRVQEFEVQADSILALLSDGVRTRTNVEAVVARVGTEPAQLAREVVRQGAKDHDDASCLVFRFRYKGDER